MVQLSLIVHVLAAVLGLGQVAAIAIVAGAAGSDGRPAPSHWTALQRLASLSRASLGIMLGSGVLIDVTTGGAFHHMWWFRISLALLLAIGVVHLRTLAALRDGRTASANVAIELLGATRRRAWVVCAGIAVITILMELKPW